MKKLFILSAFVIGTLTHVNAQSSDSLRNNLSTIKIRGIKQPFYTIDGVKQSSFGDFSISSLNPETIQEVKVLKSDDALKLYGNEAINGAILITTKLGKNSASNVEFENKLASLNLNKNMSSLRDISFIRKTTNKIDSIKPNRLPLIFLGSNNAIGKFNEPVYVIDGDKVEKGSINFLNPDLIESITVLKQNNATALYGLQATNGVVIITTKKVKKPIPKTLEKDLDKN